MKQYYLVLPFVCARIQDTRGRVLLGRHPDLPHKPYPGRWDLPGGKVSADENFEDALAREVFEETGFRVDYLELYDLFHHTREVMKVDSASPAAVPGIGICFWVEVEGELRPDELEEMHWANEQELRTLELTPWAKHFLRDLL